ncbi:MAG: hypothetical protein IK137_01985 [Bacilli bacterium]|nr:hypothetical protein [Bacilli bacterium]
MKNDNIKKIDEQIDNLKNASRKKSKDREIIIDRKYAYDDIGAGDTKKIDTVSLIKEEVVEEDTKKIDTVSEIEEKPIEETIEKSTKVEENSEPPKKNKLVPILLVVCGIIVIVLIIVLLVLLMPKTNNSSSDNEKVLSKNEQKSVINGYGDALKGVIAVYYEKQNVLLEYDDAVKLIDYKYDVSCKNHEIYDDGSIYLSKCTIDNKSTSYSYGKKQEKKEEPKISEDAIKVYVSKKNNKATLDTPSNLDEYDLYAFEIDGAYTDLKLLSESSDYILYCDSEYNVHMLNYKTNRKVMDNISYQAVLPIKIGEMYDTKYIAIKINDKWGIYNITNNERVIPHKYDSVTPILYMGTSGPALYVDTLDEGVVAVVNYGDSDNPSAYGVVNYKTGKELIKQEYKGMLKSGSYLWVTDFYGEGHIFDYNGEEYLDGKFDKIYWMVDGKYILVNDNGEIKLVSIKGKEIYSYGKIKVGNINYGLTYNNGALFQFENPEADQNDYNTGCVEVIYDAATKTGETKTSFCGGIAKPVLYLYPKKTTKVTVTFEHPEFLETTYPKYTDKWEVKAHSNGDLYDNNGAYYYALYWDEKQVHSVDFSTGYYVEKDNAISFLEQKLSYIGLSRREANEFIMYWLPILEKNEKSLVYFELTEERESYNKLNINPKPDSLLRLVIHIKKVDQKINIPKQVLTKFQRKGFVAVEWGGTVY